MKLSAFGLLALALGFASTPSLAATRSIVLPPGTIAAGLNATQLGYSVTLSGAAESLVIVPFVIPADYAAGTKLKLRLNFAATAACAMLIKADYVTRIRPGKPMHESAEGISPSGTVAVTSPGPAVAFRKTFEVTGPKSAAFAGVKPGDTYLLRIVRAKTQAGDTCGPAFVQSAEVRYTAK